MPVLLDFCIFNLFLYFYQFVAFASRSLIFSWFLTCTSWRHGMKKYVQKEPRLIRYGFRHLQHVDSVRTGESDLGGTAESWAEFTKKASRSADGLRWWTLPGPGRAAPQCISEGKLPREFSKGKPSFAGPSGKLNRHWEIQQTANVTRVWHLLGTATALDRRACWKSDFSFSKVFVSYL